MTKETITLLAVIIVYLVSMVLVGYYYSKKNENVGDFYLGGRKLGPLVTAMSAEASDMSSWLLMGLPGVAYLMGVADAAWTGIGLAVGTYVNWLIVAKRIRRYSEKINAITIPEFFSKRFGDNRNILTFIAAVVIIVFFVPYTASGFVSCGKLFSTMFGVEYLTAMIISAVVIVLYTALGGFLAASTTDFIQSIVMTIALIVVLVFGIHTAGGWDAVVENSKALPGYLSLVKQHNVVTGEVSDYGALKSASMIAWGLGYFGMPHVLLRFMAINDDKKLKTSRRVASVWVVISLAVAIVIGVVGYSMTKAGVIPELFAEGQSETLIVEVAKVMSDKNILFAILGGLIISGILASTMSTADSQLLAASSSVSENLLRDSFKLKISGKAAMNVARISVLLIAVIAAYLARDPNSSVFDIVSFAWAGFGAAFGPVILFALFWKRANKWGALAGMITGGVMVFVWKYVVAVKVGGIFAIYELLPAFLFASVAIIVVSLLTGKPSKDITDTFEEVKAMK